jgi:hypothetical protein
MDAFVETVESWHDFYMLAGSAAATLIGLIFVAVSLHIDVIATAKRSSDISVLARQTFSNFIFILSFAFIFMVPMDTPFGIGIPLLLLGLLGIIQTAELYRSFGFHDESKDRIFENRKLWKVLLLPNTICFLALIYVAVEVLQGRTGSLSWMILVIIFLLITATKNTWDLMLRVGEIKQARLAQEKSLKIRERDDQSETRCQ